jgi:hypothetical protein
MNNGVSSEICFHVSEILGGHTQKCFMFTNNGKMAQTKLAFTDVYSIIARKAHEKKVIILAEHQRKCAIF